MNCTKCGKILRIGTEQVGIDNKGKPIVHRIGYCDSCMLKKDFGEYSLKQKKKDSTLSIVACVFSGISFIFPMIIIVGYLLALTGGIIGIVDLAMNKKNERHIGSYFSIVILIIYSLIVFL